MRIFLSEASSSQDRVSFKKDKKVLRIGERFARKFRIPGLLPPSLEEKSSM
jgi:hypothetical protein